MKRLALLSFLALAACGKQEDPKPLPGHSLPQKPATAKEAPSTDELLTPGAEARPERNMEQIRRSEERKDDPFDIPPPK